MAASNIQPWDVLREYLTSNDSEGLTTFLSGLSREDSPRALMRLDSTEQQQVLQRVSREAAAGCLPYARYHVFITRGAA